MNVHDPHVEAHIVPFINTIKENAKKIKLQVLLYDFENHGQGHIALNFDLAQQLIFSKIKSEQSLTNVENTMNTLLDLLNFNSILVDQEIPSAYTIYLASNEAYKNQDFQLAKKLERLNYLLHNSYIPAKCNIGKNTVFAYGGIGIIIHEAAVIGQRCNIGSNVTIAGDRFGIPIIGHDVYISTGAKIIGNITIGDGAIIGANSVVKHNVDRFSCVAGIPAKQKAKITRENFHKYQGFYWCKNKPESHKLFCNWYFGEDLTSNNWIDYVNQPLSACSNEIVDSNLFNNLETITFPEHILQNNESWVNSGNEKNGFLFKEKSEWKFINYGEVKVTLPINWSLGEPGENNLSWQIHSLTILKDLIKSHSVTQEGWYLETAKAIILDWCKCNFVDNYPSQFSWNDHSTALRIVNISQVFLYLLKTKNLDIPFFELCQEAVKKHLLVLMTNNFYTKGTNHGLDQSFALYQVSIIFSFIKESEEAKKVALNRLTYELQKSFSNEYIHIENSPEYHLVIFSSCLQVNSFIAHTEGNNLIPNITEFINGSLEYLGYIIRPDGCFPPIGDTSVKSLTPAQWFNNLSEYSSYKGFLNAVTKGELGHDFLPWHKVYPETGYAIFRGNPSLFSHKDRPHIVFKCGFLSYYHRQDDDNNIVVFAHGEEWLTDGGLYKHDHNDSQREHMRSHYAHNVMAPEGGKADRRYCPNPPPAIIDYSLDQPSARVKGKTTIFPGYVFTRELYYDGEFEFVVKDEGEKLEKDLECNHFEQYWQIPADKEITIKDNIINIKSTCTPWIMRMSIDSINLLNIEQLKPSEGSYFCWRSSQYNILEPVQVIKCHYSIHENITQSLIKFNWIQ